MWFAGGIPDRDPGDLYRSVYHVLHHVFDPAGDDRGAGRLFPIASSKKKAGQVS